MIIKLNADLKRRMLSALVQGEIDTDAFKEFTFDQKPASKIDYSKLSTECLLELKNARIQE